MVEKENFSQGNNLPHFGEVQCPRILPFSGFTPHFTRPSSLCQACSCAKRFSSFSYETKFQNPIDNFSKKMDVLHKNPVATGFFANIIGNSLLRQILNTCGVSSKETFWAIRGISSLSFESLSRFLVQFLLQLLPPWFSRAVESQPFQIENLL